MGEAPKRSESNFPLMASFRSILSLLALLQRETDGCSFMRAPFPALDKAAFSQGKAAFL